MEIKTVAVCGASGVLGSQIALQVAVNGFKVKGWCMDDREIALAKKRLEGHAVRYAKEAPHPVSESEAKSAAQNIEFSTDLGQALQGVDFVIEAIVENLDIKRDFYHKVARLNLPEHTLLATNSSSLIPSDIMDATDRPDRFFAMHFQNEIWSHKAVELMGSKKTDLQHLKTIESFARAIKTEPFILQKEQPGYIMNTMFMPYVNSALYLWGAKVGKPWEIDQAWMKATGNPIGSFVAIDIVGFKTPPEIIQNHLKKGIITARQKKAFEYVVRFMHDMIDLNRGGKLNGEGFYHYQEKPEFMQKDFLKNVPDISVKDFGKLSGDKEKDKFVLLFSYVYASVLEGALHLIVNDVARIEDVVKVWQLSSGLDWTPLHGVREIGTEQVYAVFKAWYALEGRQGESERNVLEALKEGRINV